MDTTVGLTWTYNEESSTTYVFILRMLQMCLPYRYIPKTTILSLRKNWRSNCASIVWFAMAAFLTNYVKVNFSCVIAIITEDPNLSVAVVIRHDSVFYLLIYSLPCFGHVNHWLGAYWTTIFVTLYHFMVTLWMHRVPTFHYRSVFQRIKEVLKTYGTVVTHRVLNTQMIIAQANRIAWPALLAVKEVLAATNSANPTIITMKLPFLGIIVIESANLTEIFPHANTAVCTNLSNRLLCITNWTYNLANILSNNLMAITEVSQHARGLVMTMATREDLVATRSSYPASPPIMLASITHLPKMKAFISGGFHYNRETNFAEPRRERKVRREEVFPDLEDGFPFGCLSQSSKGKRLVHFRNIYYIYMIINSEKIKLNIIIRHC